MAKTTSLEAILRKGTEGPECQRCSYLANYLSMKNYLAEQYYPWIQANCPWFTDHGEKHVASVIQTVEHLLSGRKDVSCLDSYLLLASIIWHDVGMLATRANHARQAETFIDRVRTAFFPDQTLYRLVSQITRAHSGRDGWSFLQPSEEVAPCSHKTYTVYPQSLAALLRFADETSETRTRISLALLPNVPQEQQIYWEYANGITASKPEPARRRLLLAIELQRTAAVRRFPCPSDVHDRADSEGNVSLIEYVVCRVEKMNNERAYCFPYLTRYADIMSIEVRLQIYEGTDAKFVGEISFGDGGMSSSDYPVIRLFNQFFLAYPQLEPGNLEGGI